VDRGLGGDCVEGDAAAADFFEDLVGGGCPDEWLGVVVGGFEVRLDRGDQFGDVVEDAAADSSASAPTGT
jgi:hypothetical protein